jgi:Chitobiase/beta-hexosaminidase C-terminal domain
VRISSLAALVAFAFFSSLDATSQAITQTVQVTQGSMQSAQHPSNISVPVDRTNNPKGKSRSVTNLADQPRVFPPPCNCAKQPVFSIPPGELAAGNLVIISSVSPDATIYYTTDGWTPTAESPRYTAPIPINATTRLQAIAIEPTRLPSSIAEITYTVSGVTPPRPERSLSITSPLQKGTLLRVVTGSRINSQTAQVGDRIFLMLDQNLVVDGAIVAPDGTAVDATITKVERAGLGGKSGAITFQVHSLNVHGTTVPLSAILTLAAPLNGKPAQNNPNSMIVNVGGAQIRGIDAEIEPGMIVLAPVAADTPLHL